MAATGKQTKNKEALRQENAELRLRLAEADETLRAIREGEVDAVVVSGAKGEQIFSLVGSDSIYRLIVETMKGAAFTLTFDGQILFCNAQLGELVKRPMENIVGHRLDEFIAESGRADASSFLVAAQQQPVKQRLVFQTYDGTPVPSHVASNVLNQPDGLSICVVANDLTELENSTELIQQLRRQQEALQAANEEQSAIEEELRVQNEELAVSRTELDQTQTRFRSVLDNSQDVIYRLDAETGHYDYISPSCEKVVGYSPGELMNLDAKTSRAMIHPDDVPAFLAAQERLEKTGSATVDYRQRTKSGAYRWLSNHMSLTKDSTGRILYRNGNIRDITERKQKEKELLKSYKELEYFNKVMVGRELRMIELKKEIDNLCLKFGQPPRYGNGGQAVDQGHNP